MESFKFKPESELQEQAQKTEETLNYGHEDLTSLLPDGEAVFSMSEEDLSKKYKRRYLTYVELLRKVRSGESVDEGEFEKEYQIIKALNNIKEYIQTHKEGGTEKFALRERQIETLQKISDWLEAGGTKGHIVMPTGCGKTVIFLALVEAMGLKTFICEPTQIIQDQVITEIQEKTEMEDVAKRNTQKRDISKRVVVTTYQSLLNDVKNARIGENEVDLFIRDEAHKSLGENTSASLDLVGGIQIGFTATEDYEYKSVGDQLPDCIDKLDPIEAIRLKMISGYKNWVVGTDISLQGIKLDGSKEDDALLEKAVDVTKRNMVAVDIYKNAFRGNNSQGVCFCSGITHSENVAELFNSEGIIARHIDGDTPINERKEILAAYKRGEISILTCSDVLIEGFDEKQVDVIFNLAPSQSKVRVMQRGGRALRQDEDRDIPKVAHIFDFEDKDSKAIPYGYYLETDDTSTLAIEDEQRFSEKEEKARKDYDSIREQIMNISKGLQTALEGTANVVYDKDLYNEYLGRVDERFEKKEFLKFDQLKEYVQEANIKTKPEYKAAYKKHSGWPSSPDVMYAHDWISWDDLFGRNKKEKKEFLSFDELKNDVKDKKVENYTQYKKKLKEDRKLPWPISPDKYYEDWVSWPDLFGREKRIVNFTQLKQEVRDAGIDSKIEYIRRIQKSRQRLHWPISPDKYYEDWVSWPDLFGRESKSSNKDKIYITLEELKNELKDLGITTLPEYHKKLTEDPSLPWPRNPNQFYEDWVSFRNMLGKEDFLSFGNLKDAVRLKNIKSQRKYESEVKSNPNIGWPFNPHRVYEEWISWEDFLGKEKREFLSFDEFKQSVRSKGILSQGAYNEKAKEHPEWQWPRHPERTYKAEWVSWPNLFGKK